jgi:hypothetical protein
MMAPPKQKRVKRARPLGTITGEIEPLLEEMCFQHDLQHGEVMALILAWLQIHAPSQREEYKAGGSPIYFYGHPDDLDRRRAK